MQATLNHKPIPICGLVQHRALHTIVISQAAIATVTALTQTAVTVTRVDVMVLVRVHASATLKENLATDVFLVLISLLQKLAACCVIAAIKEQKQIQHVIRYQLACFCSFVLIFLYMREFAAPIVGNHVWHRTLKRFLASYMF